MDSFAKRVTITGQAVPADSAGDALGRAHAAKFVPGSVAVDWSELHRRLPFARTFGPQVRQLDDAIEKAGSTALTTAVELTETWEKLPLTPEASAMCTVEVLDGQRVQFKRGPPGQRSIAETFAGLLTSVCEQLRQQGVVAYPLLSSVVVISTSFDEALHRTAAVHKSLKAAGLPCHAAGSIFTPRGIVRNNTTGAWSTLDITSLGDMMAEFSAFTYAVAVHDSHLYGGVRYGYARLDGAVVELSVDKFIATMRCGFAEWPSGGVDAEETEAALSAMRPGAPCSEKFGVLEARLLLIRSGFVFDS